MSKVALTSRVEELRAARIPFVFATVVRTERPTSARPGDRAVILQDGSIEGFVGGGCAENDVRIESLKALQTQQPRLLTISPDVVSSGEDSDDFGRILRSNPCLSGGTIEMFLEPSIPDPLVFVYGHGPIAAALVELGKSLRYDVRYASVGDPLPQDLFAVVIATYGSNETDLLRASLATGVQYLGLVASVKRGRAVLDSLDQCDGIEKIHTPAGLDIGASEPDEIAVSIFAEIIKQNNEQSTKSRESFRTGDMGLGVETDIVCNMEVVTSTNSLHYDFNGHRYWFCGSGCLEAFRFEPEHYVKS